MIINQYRFLILFALFTGVLIALFNNSDSDNKVQSQYISGNNSDSKAYIKGTTITQYNKQGVPMTLNSTESALLDSGDIEITNPHITFASDEETTIVAKADYGTLNNTTESLSLEKNVVITQSQANSKTITIKTNKIFLDNINQELKTNEHVWLSDGNSTFEAIGLTASLNKRELFLKSQVRGTYVID